MPKVPTKAGSKRRVRKREPGESTATTHPTITDAAAKETTQELFRKNGLDPNAFPPRLIDNLSHQTIARQRENIEVHFKDLQPGQRFDPLSRPPRSTRAAWPRIPTEPTATSQSPATSDDAVESTKPLFYCFGLEPDTFPPLLIKNLSGRSIDAQHEFIELILSTGIYRQVPVTSSDMRW